jgi:hypothetical protein
MIGIVVGSAIGVLLLLVLVTVLVCIWLRGKKRAKSTTQPAAENQTVTNTIGDHKIVASPAVSAAESDISTVVPPHSSGHTLPPAEQPGQQQPVRPNGYQHDQTSGGMNSSGPYMMPQPAWQGSGIPAQHAAMYPPQSYQQSQFQQPQGQTIQQYHHYPASVTPMVEAPSQVPVHGRAPGQPQFSHELEDTRRQELQGHPW